jgi:hypothetical protein
MDLVLVVRVAISAERQREIVTDFEQRYEQARRSHRHFWLANVMFHVTPPLRDWEMVLGAEQLAHVPLVGCYICERGYSDDLLGQPCRGEPGP